MNLNLPNHLIYPNPSKVADALLLSALEMETRASISSGSYQTTSLIDAGNCRDAIEVINGLEKELDEIKTAISYFNSKHIDEKELIKLLNHYWYKWNSTTYKSLKKDKRISEFKNN